MSDSSKNSCKIYFGCGLRPRPGWINCDGRQLDGVDKVFDFEKIPYPLESQSADLILTQETLEHLSWRYMPKYFSELYRIIKLGGELHIGVPDVGAMFSYYVNGEICSCVPRNAPPELKNLDEWKADPDCDLCSGRARVNDDRWITEIYGAQKHHLDYHKMGFTKSNMEKLLNDSGFVDIQFGVHPYKINVKATRSS